MAHPLGRTKLFLAGILWLAAAQTATAEDVVAVLSSGSEHYKEALAGFQEALGQPVHVVQLQNGKPSPNRGQKLVVAFGAKAVLEQSEAATPVIACMAPAVPLRRDRMGGTYVAVEMAPRPDILFPQLKKIQPSLKRVALFWASDPVKGHLQQMESASKLAGIELTLIKVEDPLLLPQHLREIKGKTDALMILPDPVLINSQNFTTLKDFSWNNRVPFYVPTMGLVELGGTACVASSFKAMGRRAAKAALDLLRGAKMESVVYPEEVEMGVNLTAANTTGLKIPPEVLNKMGKVYP